MLKLLALLMLISSTPSLLSLAQPTIRVRNHPDSLTVERQIRQYLDHLEVHEPIHLTVRFTTAMSRTLPGITTYQETPDARLSGVVNVWIRKHMNRNQQRMVLAHEMVHVRQFVKGELVVTGKKRARWKGQTFRYDASEIYHYQRSPWEAEAHRVDGWLVKRTSGFPDVPFAAAQTYP